MGIVLLILIFSPLVAATLVLLIGNQHAELVRKITLSSTLFSVLLTAVVVFAYTPRKNPAEGSPVQPQMSLRYEWHSFQLPSIADNQPGAARLDFYLGIDGISLWLVALTSLLMVCSVLVSWTSITEGVASYHALLLALQCAMTGVFCAFDIIFFYIFFEFTLIPLFFLIGKWGGPSKKYAAAKFFIYTLAGSVISLVGLISLVLALHSQDPTKTLTFAIPDLATQMQQQMHLLSVPATTPEMAAQQEASRQFWYSTQFWIFLALFCGFAIKVPLAPFHTWLPLAHVEAPTAGSVLLAGVLLKLGSYGFLRLCLPLLPFASWHLGMPLIGALSVFGILYGALCALAQTDIKRLVAYSSVSHMGFCMLGMFALNTEGVSGSVMQMINHGLSTGGLFLLVGMLYERYHTRELSKMSGLAAKLPIFAISLIFICLSSAGLPGLNGFIGEVLSLIGMFKTNWIFCAIGATGVVLGAWYLLNMIQSSLFGDLLEPHHEGTVTDLNGRELSALIPIAILCVWIGVYPQGVMKAINPDVEAVVRLYSSPDLLRHPEKKLETAIAASPAPAPATEAKGLVNVPQVAN